MQRILVLGSGSSAGFNVVRLLLNRPNTQVIAADANPLNASFQVAHASLVSRHARDPRYLDSILGCCSKYGVTHVVPTSELEITQIAENQDSFWGLGAKTLLPRIEAIRDCNFKPRAYWLASEVGIDVPAKAHSVPCIVKPVRGSGSGGVHVIRSQEHLRRFATPGAYIFQEVVKGEEYTVDLLCNKSSKIVAASVRHRTIVKNGQSAVGKTVDRPDAVAACQRLCSKLLMVGACNVQFIESSDSLVFIEINPRYAAGGLMLSAKAGCNLPALAIDLMEGRSFQPIVAREGITMIRASQEFFINA